MNEQQTVESGTAQLCAKKTWHSPEIADQTIKSLTKQGKAGSTIEVSVFAGRVS